MADTNLFTKEYAKLNPAQKEAVDTIEGPVMVVAGPGTGKTQILTLRIANILRLTDTAPANILALTFTENATANLRRRLVDFIGSPAYQVQINTFHGFCNEIIKNYPEEFPRIIGSQNITEVDQIKIIDRLVQNLPLELLRPFGDPELYIRVILQVIGTLKREGLTPANFAELVKRAEANFEALPDLYHAKGPYVGKMKSAHEKKKRELEKNKELALVYEAYEKELISLKAYDFNDMIMEVLRELETNKTLLSILQEDHQYILIDEHQDTNKAQNRVIELVASFHEQPNLFVVGDEKQAIFRFQGASLENFFYFSKHYSKAKLVVLEDNYRSSQTILNQADALLTSKKKLQAKAGHAIEPIKLLTCSLSSEEPFLVAQMVKEKITAGVRGEEIAILFRDNQDAWPLVRALEKMNIPFSLESDENLLADQTVRKFLLLLRALNDLSADELVAQALHLDFLNLPIMVVYSIIRESAKTGQPIMTLLEIKLPAVSEKLMTLSRAGKNDELLPFLERVMQESGLLAFIMAQADSPAKLNAISSIFHEAISLVGNHPEAKLIDFLSLIETITKHGLLLKKKKTWASVGRVRLMTVHKSKGLEFEYVYITGAYDGHFGGRQSRDKLKLLPEVYQFGAESVIDTDPVNENQIDDERRLFYVALTRAKKGVTISWAEKNEAGREQLPSQFIAELDQELLTSIEAAGLLKEIPNLKTLELSLAQSSVADEPDLAYLKNLFEEQGLSVTALNNYLVCPWQYFYRNLIRLPAVPTKHQAYGIAIHNSLKEGFKNLKEKEISQENLVASFERSLHQNYLPAKEVKETLKRGREALSGWYETYRATWNENVLTEFKVSGVLLADIKLVGMLDKIEFIDDVGRVNVVDYKTGQPKSRNELMGLTKEADGNYYRQLVFYRLLLDLYEDRKYQMVSGEIDFIEPNDSGKYKKEKFEITDDEVEKLKDLIKKIAQEIRTLSFWTKTCANKDCEYCALRQLMK